MKTAKLTKPETARLLRAVQQIARRAGHDYTESFALEMITTLTDLWDGVRYDLISERGERLRGATTMETIEAVMSRNRSILVDNVLCYVDY